MTTSKTIAGFLGPSMLAIAISEWINLGALTRSNTTSVVYLNGSLLFLAGIAILRVHNRWQRSWPVLVTLSGWFVLLMGTLRMFIPDVSQDGLEATPASIYAMLVVMLPVGAFLTFKAYRPESDPPSPSGSESRPL